jgi:hypothetical protein
MHSGALSGKTPLTFRWNPRAARLKQWWQGQLKVSQQTVDSDRGTPMIYVYEDPDVLARRFAGRAHVACSLAVSIGVYVLMRSFEVSVALASLLTGLVWLASYAIYRHEHYGRCACLRLSDDGSCEIVAKRRSIRIHVNQVRSVHFTPADDETSESYTIHYEGGKIHVGKEMNDFHDFLTRLKTMNPAVDMRTFPAETWPEVGGHMPKKRSPLEWFMTSGAFALLAIPVVVYLMHMVLGR